MIDRGRRFNGGSLADGCLSGDLPEPLLAEGAESVRLIDVIWLDPQDQQATAAFEVEHTTSIYSGIVRLLDLALGSRIKTRDGLFLLAPDEREKDVRQQIRRPAFSGISELGIRYLPYSQP